MLLCLHWILLLELSRRSLGQEVDSSDWAKKLLAAQKEEYLVRTKPPGTSQARLHLARIHAQRGAIAAHDAEEAARQAVSLSQNAAQWLRPHQHGNAWVRRGRDDLAASLATVAAESQDAAATHRALAAARGARAAVERARAAAVPQAESTTQKRPQEVPMKQSVSVKATSTSTEPVAARKEEDIYKGERMAAQTAGLCVLTVCIVLVWFQSNAVESSYRRNKHEGDEASILHRFGMLCCCCRQIRCCTICCVRFVQLLASCSCSTLSVMGMIAFLMGYGFKQLWDQHLIQPHLEEATIYLFFATVAFVIVLVLIGSFVNWLRERVGFVHSVVEFLDEKMDVFTAFFGLDDDSDDSDQNIWADVHSYNQHRGRMPKENSGKLQDPAKEALRGRPRTSFWAPLFGKRKQKRRDPREMPI